MHHFGTLIQTDAKLNMGTSGGPLLNLKGEMVGLCVALAAAAGYETSAGYAIPVDATFRRVLNTLKEGREVEYGFLGIRPANLQPGEVLAGLHGMRVEWVVPGTPAARFGLKPDDIITNVDRTPLYDADGLVLEVGKLPVEARHAAEHHSRRAAADHRRHLGQVPGPRQEDRHDQAGGMAGNTRRLRLDAGRSPSSRSTRGIGLFRRRRGGQRGGGGHARRCGPG